MTPRAFVRLKGLECGGKIDDLAVAERPQPNIGS
jgi:hypothetical protein